MKSKKLYINISTRILIYFLFVTILPLAIISLSSTYLIYYSLDEKSEQDLSFKLETLQNQYIKVFKTFKNIIETTQFNELSQYIKKNNKLKLKNTLNEIIKINDLSFAVILDKDLGNLLSASKNENLTFYPSKIKKNYLKNMIKEASKGTIPVSNEMLSINQLKSFKLINKITLKDKIHNIENYGIICQIAVLPLYEDEKNTNEELKNLIKNEEYTSKVLQTTNPKAYLIVGNFINSNEDIKKILKGIPDLPVNVIQDNICIASNDNILFNLNDMEGDKISEIFSSIHYKGELYLDNKWYKIATEPINNYKGNTIALNIVALQDDIFRSLKSKNSVLMLQVSVLIAVGGLALAFLFAKNITTPISKMIHAVKIIESGDTNYKIDITSEDELGQLALSINEMAKTLNIRKNEILNYNKLLIDQKTKLETVFNYSADGIMTIDKDKKINSVNPAIIKWAQKPKEEIIGKYFYDIITYKTDTLKPIYNKKVDEITDLIQLSIYFPDTNINNIELDISYSPIKLDKDPDIGYVLILRDVTKRKETEELRENFIATLTHDLRVPLLAGAHTMEYLLNGSYGSLTDKQKYITEQLINSNKDLLRMVNTLLDTYSYEAGKYTLVKREININKLINECMNELKHMAIDKHHEFIFNDTSEANFVIADKQEIKRVITNLLSNAIIHTPEKGLVKIFLREEKDFLTINIKDNGIGLSDKDIQTIFQRYTKGGKTLRKVGTGLGLYLSKFIVEAHDGKIWVESKLKEGSTFSFSLPLSKKVNGNNTDE